MPDTCARACRTVTAWGTSGRWSPRRSSRESRPSSRSCITITAVNVLVLEAIRYWSSGPGVSREPTLVVPMPANHSSSPPRDTAAASPGTRPSRCWARAVRCRWLVVSFGRSLTRADATPRRSAGCAGGGPWSEAAVSRVSSSRIHSSRSSTSASTSSISARTRAARPCPSASARVAGPPGQWWTADWRLAQRAPTAPRPRRRSWPRRTTAGRGGSSAGRAPTTSSSPGRPSGCCGGRAVRSSADRPPAHRARCPGSARAARRPAGGRPGRGRCWPGPRRGRVA